MVDRKKRAVLKLADSTAISFAGSREGNGNELFAGGNVKWLLERHFQID
jgi:hypothetical protein